MDEKNLYVIEMKENKTVVVLAKDKPDMVKVLRSKKVAKEFPWINPDEIISIKEKRITSVSKLVHATYLGT